MGLISEETIQRVAAASDIVEVVGSYFPLKRAGSSWRAVCPFHQEKTPSFHVNSARQTFHCFGCGAGGGVFRFVMDYERVDFPTAVRKLAQKANIPVIEDSGATETHSDRDRLLSLHRVATEWFHRNLLRRRDAAPARNYLQSRGIGSEIAKAWQLGFAPDEWTGLLDYAGSQGFSRDELLRAGLVTQKEGDSRVYDRFRHRIIFPIRNDYGDVIGFSGRILDQEARSAKYLNSPETPLFSKGRVLFGMDKSKRAIAEAGEAIVCEGQLDLITAYEAGVKNVTAPQGTAFTPFQARLLKRFADSVVLCFDSDQAGRDAVERSIPALLEQDLAIRVARIPAGEDPDSLIRKQGIDAFQTILREARDFFEDFLENAKNRGLLQTPQGISQTASRLAVFVNLIKNPALQETTANLVASRLSLSPLAFQKLREASLSTPAVYSEDEALDSQAEELELSPGAALLIRLALADEATFQWLKNCSPNPGALLPELGLLDRLLALPLEPRKPESLSLLANHLTPPEERAIHRLDWERLPENALMVAQEAWRGLLREDLRRRQDLAKARLRQPGLTETQMLALQKEILDLQGHLKDIARPLS